MGNSHYLAFLTATLILLVIPGPAVLYIVSRSIEQGTKAGIVSVAGITVGGLFHVLFAVFGLSALLAASALAFNLVRYIGAAYLIYLGVSKLLEKPQDRLATLVKEKKLSKIFWQGLTVQIFNPKTALFFLSFLPQFVVSGKGSISLQIFGLGLSFVVFAFITDSIFAIIAGKLGKRIKESTKLPGIQKWFSGLTYLSLGTLAAVGGPSRK